MITYTKGNLLESQAEALVNTVNEVGVMGKGIALMFRDAFPENTNAYQKAAKRGEIQVGHMFVVERSALTGPRWIINFPTKKNWRHPSRKEWIHDGLRDLVRVIRQMKIRSLALPPLGCGQGGLEWREVRQEIETALSDLPEVEVIVFEPTSAYHTARKRTGIEELSPARALVAELVRRYSVLGLDCTNLEVQKLAWFLQRVILAMRLDNPLRLQFKANKYGPYSDGLRHLLDGLDGSYLHCSKRLSDAGPFDTIWFEESKREFVQTYLHGEVDKVFLDALERTTTLIDGFESPLGMELLSTVDWLIAEQRCSGTAPCLKACLQKWPGGTSAAKRKEKLFDDRSLDIALARITHFPELRRLAEPVAELT